MTQSKLGIHLIPGHGRPGDIELARSVKPSVIKIINPDVAKVSQLFQASPNSLFVLRDHPRSEQHDDMSRDPVATGIRHADECLRDWKNMQARGLPLPDVERCIWTGINEPKVWEMQNKVIAYNLAFAEKMIQNGLIAGLLNLSVGWPANDAPGQPVNWTPYQVLTPYLKTHYLILHEYWSRQGCGQNWGWWAGRYEQCPLDGKIIIGECGIDVFVEDTGAGQMRRGWIGWKSPIEYMAELAEYDKRISADSRIVGATVFTTDYESRDWVSFDTEQIHELWKQHAQAFVPPQPPQPPFVPYCAYVTAAAGLNMRTEPSSMGKIIITVPFASAITVNGEQDGWFHCGYQNNVGWMWSGFISTTKPRQTDEQQSKENVDAIINELSAKHNLDSRLAKAVFAVEAGKSGFVNGRLIARFEPRVWLTSQLHEELRTVGKMLFAYGQSAKDDTISLSGWWKRFHGDQDLEWLAITLASAIDKESALNSASFGIAQVMGFNHAMVGYATAEEMVTAFKKGERPQIEAFFAYCEAKRDNISSALQALRDGDLWRFAHLYNGSGNEAYYVEQIKNALK